MRKSKDEKVEAELMPVASLVADAAVIADALVVETEWSRNRSEHMPDTAAYAGIYADSEHTETAIAELCHLASIPLAKAIRISDTLRDLPRHSTGMASVAQNLRDDLDELEFTKLLVAAKRMTWEDV